MSGGDIEVTPPARTFTTPSGVDELPPTLVATRAVGIGGPTSPTSQPHSASMIGRDIIGQYVILSKLGEGGMGEVYLAEQPDIGRNVAIKVLHSNMFRGSDDSREGIERFRNEAKAAARLESPHIVQIFNWGALEDGTLFMAMEFLSGPTLAALLRQHQQLEPELTVHIGTQICSALTEAHAAGIVHRDLKPSNIMMIERAGDRHFAKVLDFGVAKLEGADITRSGALFGTPQYMSPEQLQAGQIDGRSDLYALGVILFELLAGKPPFSSPSAIGFITLHLNEPPPSLPKSVPRALSAVIMRLLAKDPDERPRDAALAAEQLRAALSGRAPPTSSKQRRRVLRSLLGATLVIAGLVGAAALGWSIWNRQIETEQQLAAERARSQGLETALAEESERARKAREEAREGTREARTVSEKARADRKAAIEKFTTEDSKSPSPTLSAEHRKLLGLDQPALLKAFESVLADIKLPPSEVADIQQNYRDAAASKTKDELRGHLINMISVYQRVERLKPGDHLSVAKLEQIFRTMVTREPLTLEQREEILAAITAELATDVTLASNDREYFHRLAVAKSIRQYALDSKLVDRPDRPPKPDPKSVVDPEPALPGTREPDSKDSGKEPVEREPELPALGDEGSSPTETSGKPDEPAESSTTLDSLPGLEDGS